LMRLAAANIARKRHHQPLRKLRLVETVRYTPRIGKGLSYTRAITITPGSKPVPRSRTKKH
jgi:hypothetical protein